MMLELSADNIHASKVYSQLPERSPFVLAEQQRAHSDSSAVSARVGRSDM